MRILIDVSAGQGVAEAIRALVHDSEFVRDVDPSMPDEDILAWAVREARLIVTMDKDFGELVYCSGLGHAGYCSSGWRRHERRKRWPSSPTF